MQIEIPTDVGAIAQEKAAAMGATVADYVSHLILGDDPEMLTEADLTDSVAKLDKAMEDVRAGRTMPAKEALRQVAQEFGLKLRP